jgi:hypothetical protein
LAGADFCAGDLAAGFCAGDVCPTSGWLRTKAAIAIREQWRKKCCMSSS